MDLFNDLVRFETDFWNALERRLLHADQVGLATLQALQVLDRHAGTGRVHELSRELSITIGAASKLVDRLERGGLATRRPHPEDRRSSLITLTSSGQRARVGAEAIAQPFVRSVLGDGEDAEMLSEALRNLQARLDEATAGVSA
ncbi:MAG: MarR family transcriptional regulator [Microbacterium sp.]